jgi:hypothetical protein
MVDIGFIAEEDMTTENLVDILKGAFFSVSIDDQGDIIANEGTINVWIRVSKELKLIRVFTVYSFNENATDELKCNFFKTLNSQTMFRFNAINENTFYADFNVVFSGGIMPANIVTLLRKFYSLVPLAISQSDNVNIVK